VCITNCPPSQIHTTFIYGFLYDFHINWDFSNFVRVATSEKLQLYKTIWTLTVSFQLLKKIKTPISWIWSSYEFCIKSSIKFHTLKRPYKLHMTMPRGFFSYVCFFDSMLSNLEEGSSWKTPTSSQNATNNMDVKVWSSQTSEVFYHECYCIGFSSLSPINKVATLI